MLNFYIMPQGNEVEPHLGQSKSRQGQLLFSCQGALAAAFWAVLLCGVWYRTGHRLAFVHDNAEVCLPSNGLRKRGEVAESGATLWKIFLSDGWARGAVYKVDGFCGRRFEAANGRKWFDF